MSADTVLGPVGDWSDRRAVGLSGRPGDDPFAELAARFGPVCREAVDADEIAASLEASGVGDRVAAARYGYPDVFALATELQRRVPAQQVPTVPAATPLAVMTRQALLRWALYLTPLAIVLGAAREVGRAPLVVTTAILVLGWAVSQGLAYLAYSVLGRSGPAAAARFLAVAFGAVMAGCLGVVWWLAPPSVRAPSLVVAAGELALFAAVAVTLVTGREARLVRWVLPCWLAAGALAAAWTWLPDVAAARDASLALLAISVLVVLVVAYRPVLGGGGWSWPFDLRDFARAVGHTVVGESQAGLFVAFLLAGAAGAGVLGGHLAALPLLLATPLTEVMVARHRERISRALHVFEDLSAFRRYARRAVARSLMVVAAPVVLSGGVAFAAASAWQRPEAMRYALAAMLAGVFAVTLLLAAHQRLVAAAVLIATPAALAGAVALALFAVDWSRQTFSPSDAIVALLPAGFAVLAVAFGVGLALCGFALVDPRSYR